MKNTLYLALIILLTTPVFSQNFVDKPVWQFNVLFDVGKSDIKSVYLSKLDSLANGMLTDSAFQVKITAHTDNTGSDVSNEKLSKNRAEAIKKILIQRNIDENQVAAVWKGEYEPVADNYTEGGKEQNRRVTIEVFRRIYLAKITSVIKNDSGIAVQNAFVTMRSKYLIDSTRTDSLGIFSINVPYKQPSTIEATAKEHFYDKQVLNIGVFNVKIKDFVIAKIEIGKKLTIKDLNFFADQSVLLPQSKPELQIILLFLKLNPTYKVEIAGHVNAPRFIAFVNSYEFNLSVARAKTVYDYLIANGIDEKRLIYKGYANWEMLNPTAQTESEMAPNRRVEIRIIEK